MNTTQLELQNRIKLLMEYDMKHTLSENTEIILEVGIPGWVQTLSKNVLDDVISNVGGTLKTLGGKSVTSSDDLLKVLGRTGKNSLDDISRELLRNSLLKNVSIPIKQKSNLLKDLINNQVTITKYANNTNKEIFSKFKKAGYPDDVSKTIADKLKPGNSVSKPVKPTTGGQADDVFLINAKKLYSDLKLEFPKASSGDIATLVKNIKQGLPTSQKSFDGLYYKAVKTYNPTYIRLLQDKANRLTLFEKYQSMPKKLKYGLLALGSLTSCAYITPVFGTDCSTLLSDVTNFITSGVYNTAKKLKSPVTPGTTPRTTPEVITTETQLRDKYPCINGEVGLKISPIVGNKCVFTYSDGTTDNIIINGDTATFEDGASICQ